MTRVLPTSSHQQFVNLIIPAISRPNVNYTMEVAVPCTIVAVDMVLLVVVVVQDLVGWLLLLTREEECLR